MSFGIECISRGYSDLIPKLMFIIAVSPTNLSQFKLPGPSMMRSNSIPAQDSSFDLYDDNQLCGSATSLEDRPRAISHSGSFRDSMEEGKCV